MYKAIEKYKDIVEEVNEQLEAFEQLLRISRNDKYQLVDGMLFSRIRDGYASTIKLLISDFHLESAILTRTTVEAFFILAAHVRNQEKAYKCLEEQSRYNTKKLLEILSNTTSIRRIIRKQKSLI